MNSKFDYDIVFCQLPPMALSRIYSAPPILKGIVQSIGYRARCYDFNLELYNFCNRDINLFSKLSNYLVLEKILLSSQEQLLMSNFIDMVVDTVVKANGQYIAFSVFSYYTHRITAELLLRFYQLGISDRILLGGRGLSANLSSGCIETLSITEAELAQNFLEIVKSKGLVKHAIVGDGEDAIVEFLKNGTIDSRRQELSYQPMHWSDYSDYQFDQYPWVDNVPVLDVTSSNGCVRNCDFCDVSIMFGRYKFLPGIDMAKQMIYFQQTYGVDKFIFTDSLVNGGMKHFKEFISYLSQHNATAKAPISWSGTYICRDMQNYQDLDNYYEQIRLSGGQGLTIGAESGSNHVLNAIDKKTTVEALFFELEKFRQHGITCQLLTFCGHWSERHEDFVEHCQMLVKLAPYVRSGTVSSLYLGVLFALAAGTPAAMNINNIMSKSNFDMWISRVNRGNTLKVRAKRRLILSKLAQIIDLGVLLEETHTLEKLISNIENNIDEFNKFFTKYSTDDSQFQLINNDQQFLNDILNYKTTLDIKMKFKAIACNTVPDLLIKLNDTVLWNGAVNEGLNEFDFSVETKNLCSTDNVLSIAMTNKTSSDTVLDNVGNIVKDKSILLDTLLIDNCDLVNDVEFLYSKFAPGLWSNEPVTMNFNLPFVSWYSKNSTKNRSNNALKQRNDETQSSYELEAAFLALDKIIEKLVI